MSKSAKVLCQEREVIGESSSWRYRFEFSEWKTIHEVDGANARAFALDWMRQGVTGLKQRRAILRGKPLN